MAQTLPEPAPTDASLRRALRRVRDGALLDVTEAAVLLAARGEHLDELLAAASRIRDAGLAAEGRPGVVTYSRKVFIPLTRLCQDRCHYCTFATVPHKLPAAFLERDEVLEIARAGAAAGCKEALFTLGDRPEARWPAAREWLDARGYDSTLDYVRACAIAVLEETGLLPHLNPGVLSWEELTRLKPVAPSMGMMLETTATRLWSEPGGPHYGSPDKEPAVRLRTLTDAGRVGVPFTTGILIGIGENRTERAESIFAIRAASRAAGHIQEVIVQNFRAKPDTAMRNDPDADLDDLAATIAVTRIVLGPKMHVQAPPNLVGDEFALMLRAGIDDWGGVSPVTADHVNPERPWPAIDELATRSQAAGFTLRERLTVYPKYVRAGSPWIDTRLHAHVAALSGDDGLANESAVVTGRPWQEPDGGFASTGRTDLNASIDTEGRTEDRRGDFESVYGDWDALKDELAASQQAAPVRLDSDVRAGLALAGSDPSALLDPAHHDAAMALILADGPALEELTRLADDVRRDVNGDEVTYVINRNINFSNVCYVGCRFCAFAQRERDADAFRLSLDEVASRAVEAAADGATEVCVQGGIDPQLPVTFYADLVRAVKAAVPGMHVHAFSPMEIVSAAAKAGVSIEEWLTELRDAGLGSIPGTAAEILDDEVRWVLTKGKLPASQWLEVVGTAHELGIASSSTMMYGHVDEPRHWLGHLRTLARQQDESGGFTEFVPLPFVHHNAPIYLAGLARPGPTERDNRAVHAVARLALHGRIDHIQCSWVKLGDDLSADILRGGADDMGGTLMEETISRMAGSENGSARTVTELAAIAHAAGRPVRQRTTTYVGSPTRLEPAGTAPPRLLPLTTA
ncbi:bifunctional FO biosynthesis protein CofGH [Pseudonocardia abyssalis]|uniref:FO synthase n=1 Tax=Pseudonocardia abyssalis TaxID=2792008 RepID=A0ABS6V0Z4_9PSEU|nr:bifunctional FO biosynthesis protein CofGH [Pseudonocardia abyssalis]MBW0114499.1 bifunctional FO biosynthesis protein CofGH [Pseudonocardia abyssalis]MBW0138187.1 bifunctional FO biosynthesis protein CofGH [Pseudonocardia abyssalis]